MRNWGIIERYILYTNLIILLLILFVPIGTFLLTGKKTFLEPIHLVLAVGVGLIQIFIVNKFLKKELEKFWQRLGRAVDIIIGKIKRAKKLKDIRSLRTDKDRLLSPFMKEKNLGKLVANLNHLLSELLDILELNLIKDDIVRKLTTTLNTKILSQILANNLIKTFDLPAVAVYLKSVRDDHYELVLNRGFATLKAFVDNQFAEKVKVYPGYIFEERFNWTVDKGVCDAPADRLLVLKLNPRKDKIVGFVFIAVGENADGEKLLKNFLQEVGATVSLIFENALEHEKSILLASYDPLTGAYNRQEGLKVIRALLKKAEVEQKNVCLLVLDIDHFKKINDTYGHDVGDIVLREVVSIIRSSIRNQDIVVRWGGEEFLIAIANVPPEKAREIAERIRSRVENTPIVINDQIKLKVTVSIGVACTEKEGTYFFDDLFNIADKRLYRAKRSGRNLVIAD